MRSGESTCTHAALGTDHIGDAGRRAGHEAGPVHVLHHGFGQGEMPGGDGAGDIGDTEFIVLQRRLLVA